MTLPSLPGKENEGLSPEKNRKHKQMQNRDELKGRGH